MTVAIPAEGTTFYLEIADGTGLTLTPTDITKSKPATVTVDDTTGVAEGQVVLMTGTNISGLDNNYFVATNITGTSFDLGGSDTTDASGTLGTSPVANVAVEGESGNFTVFCLNAFSRTAGTADTVSVGTFCDPSATIPGTADAGTATFSGYMDPDEDAYIELLKATDDKQPRIIYIRLPQDKGIIVLKGAINSFSEDITLGQAISWSSGIALSTNPKYIWPDD